MSLRSWTVPAVAVLVAACAGGTTVTGSVTPDTTASSATEPSPAGNAVEACLLLTDAEVSEYVGRAVTGAPVAEVNSLSPSLNQCGWAEGPDDVPVLQLGVWENSMALADFAAGEGTGLAAEPIEGLDVPVVWVHATEGDSDFGIDPDLVFYLIAESGSRKVQITPTFDIDPSTVEFDNLTRDSAAFGGLVDLLSTALGRL